MEAEKVDIKNDIEFIKTILPLHYEVKESKTIGSIHCKSDKGLRKGDYEDEIHWNYFLGAIRNRFGARFSEVFHNTCSYHQDFTIYLM